MQRDENLFVGDFVLYNALHFHSGIHWPWFHSDCTRSSNRREPESLSFIGVPERKPNEIAIKIAIKIAN